MISINMIVKFQKISIITFMELITLFGLLYLSFGFWEIYRILYTFKNISKLNLSVFDFPVFCFILILLVRNLVYFFIIFFYLRFVDYTRIKEFYILVSKKEVFFSFWHNLIGICGVILYFDKYTNINSYQDILYFECLLYFFNLICFTIIYIKQFNFKYENFLFGY